MIAVASASEPLPPGHPLASGRTEASALVTALRGERGRRLPVWFMRQAGRSLPEYRELRSGTRMLDACLDPALASEITLQPVRRHGVDAAIFFSDIVVPLLLAGVDVRIEPNRGPVFAHPVRTAGDVAELPELDPAALDPITRGVELAVAELDSTPLIAFAGAPFTLAAYLVEGGPSRDHLRARTLMHADPLTWHALVSWAARVSGAFLVAQVRGGASAAQLFDSWAGSLSVSDYAELVAPASRAAIEPVRSLTYPGPGGTGRVPTIHFGLMPPALLAQVPALGVDAVGVDWRTPLSEALSVIGPGVAVQGNIDPALLAAPWPVLAEHAAAVVRSGAAAPGHVVNLGHGVPPTTDPAVLTRLVAFLHDLDASPAPAEGRT